MNTDVKISDCVHFVVSEPEIIIVNDIVDFGGSYYFPFQPYGKQRSVYMHGEFGQPIQINIDNAKLIVFTGGVDISPAIYNETRHPKTQKPHLKRDWFDIGVFKKAKEKNIPCFGICRGAQLLCALSGGKLDQHVSNHYWNHELITSNGEIFKTNSSHHQVQIPSSSANVIGWTKSPNNKIEVEAVEYPTINAAGVQFHPEAMTEEDEALIFTRKMVEKLLCR